MHNVIFMFSLTIPVLITSFSISAAKPELQDISFPETNYPESCKPSITGQCKVYSGTESLDVLYISRLDSASSYPVYKSFGYNTAYGQGNNNTLILKEAGDISGIIRGISTTGRVGASFQNNNVYIDLNNKDDKPLLLVDTPQHMTWGGGISAASASYGKELVNNNVFIQNSSILSDISITGASAAASSLLNSFQDGIINKNSVVIDSSVISDTSTHEAIRDGAIIAGAYLFSPVDTFIPGKASALDMSENSLYIRDSILAVDAMAAAMTYNLRNVDKFTAYNNNVYIEDSHINTGDKVFNRIFSAMGYDVQKNNLIIKNSLLDINTLNSNYVMRAAYYAEELATHNNLIITNTTINTLNENTTGSKGGVIISGAWSKDTSKNNAVYLERVKLGKAPILINGGSTDASGIHGIADNNSVILKNTDLQDSTSVMGGYVQPPTTGSSSISGSASGNTVIIEGSQLAGNIYGGMLGSKNKPGEGRAENNTVTIGHGQSGRFNNLYGGFGANMEYTYKGNTLNLYSNISTTELGGFQHYNFYYTDMSQLDLAMIQVNGDKPSSLYTTRKTEDNSIVTVMTKGLDIIGGTKFQLISNASGFIDADTGNNLTKEDLKKIGAGMTPEIMNFKSLATIEKFSPLEDYHLEINDGTLSAVINQPEPDVPDVPDKPVLPNRDTRNDQTDILSITQLATLSTLIASDELLTNTVLTGSESRKREGAFAAIRYGDYKYNTQSKLRTDQTSALFGYGFHSPKLDYGIFLETGYNNYSAHTDSIFGEVYGSGDQNYGGTGIYFDYSTPVKGLHTTAYLKGGVIYNDFDSYIAMTDIDASEASAYWGAHVGLYWDISVTNNWDGKVFASYFYDGQDKEKSHVSDSEITYSELHSHRIHTGLLATYTGNTKFRPYLGISWEEMMNTETHVSISDSKHRWNNDAEDMNGGTMVINTGVNYINSNGDIETGVNIKGYNGMRNGVAAQIQLKWNF